MIDAVREGLVLVLAVSVAGYVLGIGMLWLNLWFTSRPGRSARGAAPVLHHPEEPPHGPRSGGHPSLGEAGTTQERLLVASNAWVRR